MKTIDFLRPKSHYQVLKILVRNCIRIVRQTDGSEDPDQHPYQKKCHGTLLPTCLEAFPRPHIDWLTPQKN